MAEATSASAIASESESHRESHEREPSRSPERIDCRLAASCQERTGTERERREERDEKMEAQRKRREDLPKPPVARPRWRERRQRAASKA